MPRARSTNRSGIIQRRMSLPGQSPRQLLGPQPCDRNQARWKGRQDITDLVERGAALVGGGELVLGEARDLLDQLLSERPAERLVAFGNHRERAGTADDMVLEVFLQAARRIGVLGA